MRARTASLPPIGQQEADLVPQNLDLVSEPGLRRLRGVGRVCAGVPDRKQIGGDLSPRSSSDQAPGI